jgi:hypothetical protein
MRPERRSNIPRYSPPGGTTQPPGEPTRPALPAPGRTTAGPREKAPGGLPRKPPGARMAEVTVKLPDALIAKLDRLRDRHSTGPTRPGRSTLMRWLLEREPE